MTKYPQRCDFDSLEEYESACIEWEDARDDYWDDWYNERLLDH